MNRRSLKEIRKNITKINDVDFKIGDYVFATKYADADAYDRWVVDNISAFSFNKELMFFEATGVIPFKYGIKITPDEGKAIIRYTPKH